MKQLRIGIIIMMLFLTFLITACANETPVVTTGVNSEAPAYSTEAMITVSWEYVEPPQAETPHYVLENENGEAYLRFTDTTSESGKSEDDEGFSEGLLSIPVLQFTSLSEMESKLLSGDLTQGQLLHLRQMAETQNPDMIPIPNLNRLYEPVLTNGTVHSVRMYANRRYMFAVSCGGFFGFFEIHTKESLDTKYQQEYDKIFHNELVTVTQTVTDSDGNRMVVYSHTSRAEIKDVFTTVDNAYGKYTIRERYTLSNSLAPDTVHIGEGGIIYVFAELKNGGYVYVYLKGEEKRPTLQELASISIRNYVVSEQKSE